jgi:hypothetical protein
MTRLLGLLLAGVVVLTAGCGSVTTMREEFVALRYVQEAESNLRNLPRNAPRAVEELDRAITLMPDDIDLMRRAALLFTAARAWEKAIPLFEALDDLEPRDPPRLRALPPEHRTCR